MCGHAVLFTNRASCSALRTGFLTPLLLLCLLCLLSDSWFSVDI